MNELMSVPKNVTVYSGSWELTIENHEVMYSMGVFWWLLFSARECVWKDVVSEMISKGFKFDSTIEYCISEIQKNPTHIGCIMHTYWKMPEEATTLTLENWGLFCNSPEGIKLRADIIQHLGLCRNWDELYKIISYNSEYQMKLQELARKSLSSFALQIKHTEDGS